MSFSQEAELEALAATKRLGHVTYDVRWVGVQLACIPPILLVRCARCMQWLAFDWWQSGEVLSDTGRDPRCVE